MSYQIYCIMQCVHTHFNQEGKKNKNKIKQFLLYNRYTEIPGFMGQIHYS